MRKLLSAEIHRCKQNTLFWLMLCAAILSGAIYGIFSKDGSFDDMYVYPLFIVEAAFFSLHIGREYTDNTIRNKIISGHTKINIFLSKLVFAIGIGLLFTVAFLIPCGIVLSKTILPTISMSVLLWAVGGFILLSLVWVVLFTVTSTLITAKGLAGILNLALIIGLMVTAYQLEVIIAQPEYIFTEVAYFEQMTPEDVERVQLGTYEGSYSFETDDSGIVTYYKSIVTDEYETLNPNYIEEPLRSILEHLDSLLPSGQVNEYVSCLTLSAFRDQQAESSLEKIQIDDYPRLKTFPLYSCFALLLLSSIGLLVFRKKDIK